MRWTSVGVPRVPTRGATAGPMWLAAAPCTACYAGRRSTGRSSRSVDERPLDHGPWSTPARSTTLDHGSSVRRCVLLVGVDVLAVLRGGVLVEHVGVVEGILTGEHPIGLLAVDLLDPAGDHQGGDGVTGEVGQRAGL